MESLSSKCPKWILSDESSRNAHSHAHHPKINNFSCWLRVRGLRWASVYKGTGASNLLCRVCLLLKFLLQKYFVLIAESFRPRISSPSPQHSPGAVRNAFDWILSGTAAERRQPQVRNNLQNKQSTWWALIELCGVLAMHLMQLLLQSPFFSNLFLIMESAKRRRAGETQT